MKKIDNKTDSSVIVAPESRHLSCLKIDIDTPYFACFHHPFLAKKTHKQQLYIYIYIYIYIFKYGDNYFLNIFYFKNTLN